MTDWGVVCYGGQLPAVPHQPCQNYAQVTLSVVKMAR